MDFGSRLSVWTLVWHSLHLASFSVPALHAMFSLCASRHLALFSLCVFSLWPLVICADVCVAEKVDVGNAIIKLMSAAVQATVMGSLAPFVLYFGRDIDNIVIVVQAALIADFAKLSFYFEGFCPAKIPIIGKGFLNV